MIGHSLHSLARALGGEVSGRAVLCPGPDHSARDRSLSVMPSTSAPDGFLVWSHAGDDPLAAKDYVRLRLGFRSCRHRQLPRHRQDQDGSTEMSRRREGVRGRTDPDGDRTTRALAIWNQARTPIGSPVERNLVRRGLGLPDDPREVIRFHPSCPFAGKRTRAMVALVRHVETNAPVAIHRTALDLAGNKIEVDGKDRLALGSISVGAVKLTANEHVGVCLGIGEGIETTLSLQRLPEFGTSPVWALLNAGGIAAFPVLSGIECLWVAVDNDPAGLAAADAVAQRWRRAGREVFLVSPIEAGTDLNDLLKVRHG